MATLLRDPRIQEYDILAFQEPWRNPFISTTHNPITHSFHLRFPNDSREAPARVCFFVNKRIDPNRWRFTGHTRDLCTIEITTKTPATEAATKIYIHNVYNSPRSSDHRTSCLPHLRTALSAYQEEQIILGDFNLHHELWGGLTVRERDPESDDLIDLVEDFQLGSLNHDMDSVLVPRSHSLSSWSELIRSIYLVMGTSERRSYFSRVTTPNPSYSFEAHTH